MEQVTGHSQVMADAGRQILEYVSHMQEECGMGESKEDYEQRIAIKLRFGKKLTAEEMNYLARTNPVMYQKAFRTQMMRKSLEEQLKRCRSRQEAEQVYANAFGSVSKDDPDREMIVAALNDAYKEFCGSGAYQKLPLTEEEADRKGSMGGMEIAVNDSGYQEIYLAQGHTDMFSAEV